jgi:hypothetical protein
LLMWTSINPRGFLIAMDKPFYQRHRALPL